MSDSEEERPAPTASPDAQPGPLPEEPTAHASQHTEDRLTVARRFLEDDEVKAAPREKKIEFLKAKGIEDAHIDELLGEPEEAPAVAILEDSDETAQIPQTSPIAQQNHEINQPRLLPGVDRPPVVTYPEFMTKPDRPPPLVTTNRLVNTLYAFAGLSTILYGTSKFVIAPMVESLTDARADLHETTFKKLASLVTKLESTVSVVPSPKGYGVATPDDSEAAEDPAEMFHRDMGTQTSFPATPITATPSKVVESESMRQAETLARLTKSLSGLTDGFRSQSQELGDIKTLMDVFRDELDTMTYGGHGDFVGGYDIYGKSKRAEPEDEIRKVRDNIRRVKGVLLSTRSFPTSTR